MYPVTTCFDCMHYLVNGVLPEDPDSSDWDIDTVHDTLTSTRFYYGDSDDDQDFATSTCACCRSSLPGSRHAASAEDL